MAGNANSGRRRKPEALRELHGSVERPHHRARPEPKFEPARPSAPKTLSKDAKKEWNRVVRLLHQHHLVSKVDLAVVAGYCTLFGIQEQCRREMQAEGFTLTYPSEQGPREQPVVRILRQTTQQMRAYLAELGFTPASRAKVTPLAEPTPAADAGGLANLMGRLAGSGKVVPLGGRR